MGTFTVPISVAHPLREENWSTIQALADTGAFYTWLPASLLTSLGVQPIGVRDFRIATGQVVQRVLGEVRLRINGESRTVLCVFGDEGSTPLLGAHSLEAFALSVDAVNKRLTPVGVLPAL